MGKNIGETIGRKVGFLTASIIFGAMLYFVSSKLRVMPSFIGLMEMILIMLAINIIYQAIKK